MKRIIAMLLMVAVVLGLMAGCGSTQSQPQTTAPAQQESQAPVETTPATTEAPKNVRTDLVLCTTADIGTLDPMAAMTGGDGIVAGLAYESLIHTFYEYDADGNTVNSYKGLLAESWEFSEDFLTVTFHLKKGVKFHNGEEMTAEDVIYSFERALQSESKKARMENYAGAEAKDDYTVVMTLSAVTPAFLDNMTYVPVLCKSYMENGGEEAILTETCGTGAYVFVEHKVAQSITLAAFEDYHQGAAQIKTIRYDVLPDSASALMAFEAGSFDYFEVPADNVNRIAATGKWTMVERSNIHPVCVYLNHGNELFKDVRVRQAVAYATNKENLIALAQDGLGTVADVFFNPELMVNTSRSDFNFTYNPEKAKELLTEAGYPNGEGLPTIKLETIQRYEKYCIALQQDLAAVGINIELIFTDANTFVGDLASGNYELAMNMASLSTLVYPWRMLFMSEFEGETNFAHVNDPVIDDLFARIGSTMDQEEQKELIHELNTYTTENVTYLPLVYMAPSVAYNPDLVMNSHPRNTSPYYLSWAN